MNILFIFLADSSFFQCYLVIRCFDILMTLCEGLMSLILFILAKIDLKSRLVCLREC